MSNCSAGLAMLANPACASVHFIRGTRKKCSGACRMVIQWPQLPRQHECHFMEDPVVGSLQALDAGGWHPNGLEMVGNWVGVWLCPPCPWLVSKGSCHFLCHSASYMPLPQDAFHMSLPAPVIDNYFSLAPVAHACNPSYLGGSDQGRINCDLRPAWANSSRDSIFKITRAKWTGGVAQAVELLLCKSEALSSNSSLTHTHKMTCSSLLKAWATPAFVPPVPFHQPSHKPLAFQPSTKLSLHSSSTKLFLCLSLCQLMETYR
jgi:hypothetical protein